MAKPSCLSCIVVVVMTLGALAHASEPPSSKPPTEIDRFGERTTQLFAAMAHRDLATLDQLLAGDFIFTNFAGGTGNKQLYLEGTKLMVIDAYKLTPIAVHIYGGAAVVMYRVTIKARIGDKAWPKEITSTDTWVKQADAWKLAARHSSVVGSN